MELKIKEGEHELFDGFPEYITFKTSIPATVYYTLDGSRPDENSIIAVGRVYLPTLSGALDVKAVAIMGDERSDVLEKRYENTSLNLDGRRNIAKEGVAVMRSGDESVDSLGYLYDGSKAQELSDKVGSFDIKASSTNSIGEGIGGGKTSRDFVNFSEPKLSVIGKDVTNTNSPKFDPSAKYIIVDGFSKDAKENQVVKVVNRPYNNFGPTTNFYKERLGEKEPIITGNYVRSFYNPSTGKYVSYYWESLESRWIRSEQYIDKKPLNTSSARVKKFVYRWIQDRALSQLF